MPPHALLKPVHVLEELPAEAGLADAGDADDRDEMRPPLVGGRVEQLLDESELAVAPDEGRLDPDGLERASATGSHAKRAPERHRLRLALELVLACSGVGDRRFGGALRRFPDEHGSGLRFRLDPGRRVDQVAGDHPLALRRRA